MKRIIYILLFLLSAPHVYSQKILEVQQEFKQDTARIEGHVRNAFLANTADFVQCMNYSISPALNRRMIIEPYWHT